MKLKLWIMLALAALMAVHLCAAASADEISGTYNETISWTYNPETGKLTVIGTGDMSFRSKYDIPWYNYRNNIKNVVVEGGITSLDGFYECKYLTGISVPDSITTIRGGAFQECIRLESIDIPYGVTAIGNSAFSNCQALISVNLPSTVTSIGESAFNNCTGLIAVSLQPGLETIRYNAFNNCTSLRSIDIPSTVTLIGTNVFQDCINLTGISIPANPGDKAFYGCTNLASVDIADGVTSLGKYTFYNCQSLTDITVPDSVTSIGTYTFYNCSSLKSVRLSDAITSIAASCFQNCVSLTEVAMPEGVDSIGISAFSGCGLKSVTLPKSVLYVQKKAFSGCDSLADVYYGGTALDWDAIQIYDNNEPLINAVKHFSDPSGVCGENLAWTISKEGTLTVSGTGDMTNYSLFGYTPWSGYADSVFRIVIENGVTGIGNSAFSGCQNLIAVTVPSSLTRVGTGAFQNCAALTDVYCLGTEDDWNGVAIGLNNTPLNDAEIHFGTSGPGLLLPASLTGIEAEAFSGISAEAVVIPATVTSISGNPFAGSDVTTICGYDDTWRSWAENNGYVFVLLDGD